MTTIDRQESYCGLSNPGVSSGLDAAGCNHHRHVSSRGKKGRDAVLRKARGRPHVIRNAMGRLPALAVDNGLSHSDVAVLAAILSTCVSRENALDVMYARKATLARNAGVSEATFYRAYAKFQQRGWIVVDDQKRHGDGSLGITHFQLTPIACDLLGLPYSIQQDVIVDTNVDEYLEDAKINDQAGPELSATTDGVRVGPIYVDPVSYPNPQQFIEEQSAVAPSNTVPDRFVVRSGKCIPADLVELIDQHHIPPTGVLKLMKTSRAAAGHRLSDIYAAVKGGMQRKGLRGNACYSYLYRCAADTQRDWTAVGAKAVEITVEKRKKVQRRITAEHLVGKIYRSTESGLRWRVIRSGGGLPMLEGVDESRYIPLNDRILPDILQKIEQGILLPERLPRETLA